MKKTFIMAIMALASIMTFTACDDDDPTLVFPTWKGFKIDQTTLNAGDTLRIHADLDRPGKYLYKVHYKWTMVVDTISEEGKVALDTLTYKVQSTTARPIHMNDTPNAYFLIPKNAVKGSKATNFTFTCDYEHAASGTPEPLETAPHDGYLGGVFKYQVLSPLYSRTSNRFSTMITIE